MTLLILRPEPGASESAARAEAVGLDVVTAPLFTIEPLAWEIPAGAFDAVMITSANAARHGGAGLAAFASLPCYAVGESSADAARTAGFADVRTGPSDGAALVAEMEADGIARAFHPSGRDHVALRSTAMKIERRAVYAAEPVEALPEKAATALQKGALALLHSPRAAAQFAMLVDAAGISRREIRVTAISEAAAAAAGGGWKTVAAAPAPRDEALLELAAKLCNKGAVSGTGLAQ